MIQVVQRRQYPWIQRLEKELGYALLPGLRALYERGDGETDAVQPHHIPSGWPFRRGRTPTREGRPMRLLSSEEAISVNQLYEEHANLRHSRLFWKACDSEYAALYMAGPLAGRIYFWTYDGRHDSVAFRSIRSFLESMNMLRPTDVEDDETPGWHSAQTDYFVASQYFYHEAAVCKPASHEDTVSDVAAREALQTEYASAEIESELDDHHFAFNIMALTPADQAELLLPFLDSKDMWIQARACEILGNRKAEWAVHRLEQIAVNGTANGRSAAKWALGRIGTGPAADALLRSAPKVEEGERVYIAFALEHIGYEIRRDWMTFDYRAPGENAWRRLCG